MGNLEDSIEFVKAERVANAKVTGSPDEEKTSKQLKRDLLKKEILEDQKAIEALKAKKAKEALKSEFVEHETKPMPDLPVYTVKPVFHPGSKAEKAWNRKHKEAEPVRNSNAICPFCLEEKSTRGMNRHISAIHKVPGVTIQDLDDVEKGLKSLEDLVAEKFPEGEAEIVNLAPEVEEKHFSDWEDIEEDPEALEVPEAIPEKESPEEIMEEESPEEIPEKESPEEIMEEERSGNPKSEYEFTCPDAPFPYNLLRRKKQRKKI